MLKKKSWRKEGWSSSDCGCPSHPTRQMQMQTLQQLQHEQDNFQSLPLEQQQQLSMQVMMQANPLLLQQLQHIQQQQLILQQQLQRQQQQQQQQQGTHSSRWDPFVACLVFLRINTSNFLLSPHITSCKLWRLLVSASVSWISKHISQNESRMHGLCRWKKGALIKYHGQNILWHNWSFKMIAFLSIFFYIFITMLNFQVSLY